MESASLHALSMCFVWNITLKFIIFLELKFICTSEKLVEKKKKEAKKTWFVCFLWWRRYWSCGCCQSRRCFIYFISHIVRATLHKCADIVTAHRSNVHSDAHPHYYKVASAHWQIQRQQRETGSNLTQSQTGYNRFINVFISSLDRLHVNNIISSHFNIICKLLEGYWLLYRPT